MFNNNLCSLVCMGRDLINPVVARWLDGKCQRLLATALKVQHCWTLKTTVGDCWRQSPTCAGDSRQLKYKHTRDCRRLSPSRATVGDCRRLKYKPGFRRSTSATAITLRSTACYATVHTRISKQASCVKTKSDRSYLTPQLYSQQSKLLIPMWK